MDGDSLPTHGEKPVSWRASGKRAQRGLDRSESGFSINADCNGAANIIRKVATQLGINLVEISSGSKALPQRYEVITNLSKSYRQQALR
ncbi:MAG: hypothetical protein F6K36_06515 [Symploca sp. SIO3C6]|uniref:Transposase n=1 Tax=Symploca sp. SIO1C4 TaxID=2607765 RepID=A0A6B3NMZ9_9CYAN|nr:hypothetical protein [Symploca sp. SIO3C6]NER31604.1 hypothetical protein [Symploca sp. SIO1C4]